MLGVPAPDGSRPELEVFNDGPPVWMEQDGWRMEYNRYRDVGHLRLPDRLTLDSEDIHGRVFITQWDVALQ